MLKIMLQDAVTAVLTFMAIAVIFIVACTPFILSRQEGGQWWLLIYVAAAAIIGLYQWAASAFERRDL